MCIRDSVYRGFKTIDRDLSVSNNFIEPVFEEVIKEVTSTLKNEEKDTCMNIIKSFLDNPTDSKIEGLIVHPEITLPRIKQGLYGPNDENYEEIIASTKFSKNGKYIILLTLSLIHI